MLSRIGRDPFRSKVAGPLGSILVLAAALAAGCAPQDGPSTPAIGPPAETEPPAAATPAVGEPTSTLDASAEAIVPAVTPLTEDTATYADRYAGFAFQYPAGWSLIPPNQETKEQATVYSATLSSWDPAEIGTEGIPKGGVKLDVIVIKEDVQGLQDAVQWRMSQLEGSASSGTITSQATWELPGGLLANRASISSQDLTAEEMFTVIEGRIVLLSALGDTSIFDRIAVTLEQIE